MNQQPGSVGTLFLTFLKIGAFTFGGGYAMLPLIQSEVARHGWMTNAQLVDFVAVSESTPGPFAVNISTYVGMVTGGPLGAVCATLGVVLPSFFIILLVARCFVRFQSSRVVQGCLSGLRPAVVGLIAAAVASVGLTVFFPGGFHLASVQIPGILVALGIFLLSLILVFRKVHPIVVICLSGLLGIGAGFLGLI